MKKFVLKMSKNRVVLVLSSLLILSVAFVLLFKSQTVRGEIKELGDYVYSSEVKIKTGDKIGDYDTISGYMGFSWEKIESIMASNKTRLLNEYALEYEGDDWIGWNNINPNNKPEGQVWKTDSNLMIGNLDIGGKGTIIVNGGNIIVNGNLAYVSSNSSVGFIVVDKGGVGGYMTIESSVSNLIGAYYASREIKFK